MTSSRSFGRATGVLSTLEDALTHHVSHLAERLRKDAVVTSVVQLHLSWTEDGAQRYGTLTAPIDKPTSDTREIAKAVLHSARAFATPGKIYRKAGVTFLGICPIQFVTENLFTSSPGSARGNALMAAIDRITARHGRHALRLGTERARPLWRAREAFISKSYTTSWGDIPHVRNEL
jgi:DNA polymerase V